MLETAVNRDYTGDVILRASPKNGSFTVEEHKCSGVVSYKEISPLDFYAAVYGSFEQQFSMRSGLLPPNCLQVTFSGEEKHFVIWHAEQYADIAYRDREYLHFPIPRLVFAIRTLKDGRIADCSLGVVADEPPTTDTKMYHYPFSNVYPDLRLCVGNNIMPHYKHQSLLHKLPYFLLGIPNNDDMFTAEHNRLGLGYKELLEHLKDKEPAYYYTDVLVESGRTLADFIARR